MESGPGRRTEMSRPHGNLRTCRRRRRAESAVNRNQWTSSTGTARTDIARSASDASWASEGGRRVRGRAGAATATRRSRIEARGADRVIRDTGQGPAHLGGSRTGTGSGRSSTPGKWSRPFESIVSSWRSTWVGRSGPTKPSIIGTGFAMTTGSRTSNCGAALSLTARGSRTWLSSRGKSLCNTPPLNRVGCMESDPSRAGDRLESASTPQGVGVRVPRSPPERSCRCGFRDRSVSLLRTHFGTIVPTRIGARAAKGTVCKAVQPWVRVPPGAPRGDAHLPSRRGDRREAGRRRQRGRVAGSLHRVDHRRGCDRGDVARSTCMV